MGSPTLKRRRIMKAISLYQPYASAMALEWKKIETRSWGTSYRGPLLIHAAKKIIGWPSIEVEAKFWEHEIFDDIAFDPSALPRDVLLCRVDLIDCKKISIHNRPGGLEGALGNYTPGWFMWVTEGLKTFDPIPFRGMQRIFEVPDEILPDEIFEL